MWEHRNLLDRLDELIATSGQPPGGNWLQVRRKVDFAVRFMELHQESEERFLFPLVSDLGNPLLSELRQEHRDLFQASDSLVALVQLQDTKEFRRRLGIFRKELSAHFSREESGVFLNAQRILSPAQLDILKIKFATRSVA